MSNETQENNFNKYPDYVNRGKLYEARPVYAMLDDTVRDFGARPGMDFMGKKYSWAELGSHVDKMAKGLQNLGVTKDTRVGICLPNSPYYLISYYAILKAGGIVVNLNPLYSLPELKHLLTDSEAEFVVTADLSMLYDKLHEIFAETNLKKLIICRFTESLPFPKNILFPIVKSKDIAKLKDPQQFVWYCDICKNDGKPKIHPVDPVNDVAVLQYTGGTTGVPKGAMLTHYNVVANVEQSTDWFPTTGRGQERMLGILPFFHVFAMTTVMNMSVRNAFELITIPRFELDATLKLIHKKKPHYLPAVPAIYNAINNHKKRHEYDLTSLKYCVSGGAPLPVEVKKTFERNTGCIVVEGYGLTEASPVLCANPIVGANKAGSIGLPFPATTIEIINPDDKVTPMKVGERGELCARGPQIMKGYWKRPTESEDALRAGRLHTGDIAVMDEDGYIYIVDRIKDLIITNGYNVYPRNVEEAIYTHEGVEETIVAGVPDEQRGEIVKAWIKPKSGVAITPDEMKNFLKDILSPMEMPRYIEIRSEPLPKTMIGKLSRKDILAEEKKKREENIS
jgi:long-chain acyl-CoA synthetase